MASRKPLVIVAGEIQQLQSGDTLNAVVTTPDSVTLTADNTLIAGNAVYSTGNDTCDKAKADASGTSKVVGLATAAITGSSTGTIQTNGVMALTTTQWDAVFGTSGGLTANTDYYLSAGTAGLGTGTAPTTAGQYVVYLGRALSTTELMIDIDRRILL